jgi:hypothetical protein
MPVCACGDAHRLAAAAHAAQDDGSGVGQAGHEPSARSRGHPAHGNGAAPLGETPEIDYVVQRRGSSTSAPICDASCAVLTALWAGFPAQLTTTPRSTDSGCIHSWRTTRSSSALSGRRTTTTCCCACLAGRLWRRAPSTPAIGCAQQHCSQSSRDIAVPVVPRLCGADQPGLPWR